MKIRLRSFVSATVLAALTAATAVFFFASDLQAVSFKAAFTLAGLGVLTTLLAYRMPRGGNASIALIPFIASALLAPGFAAVAAVGVAQATNDAFSRRQPVKAIFNIAQAVLSMSLATSVYVALGGRALAQGGDSWSFAAASAPRIVALLAVFVLTNTLAVSGVLSITQGIGWLTVWRENTLGTAAYTFVAGVVAYVLAVAYIKWGVLGSALLIIPLIAFRQFYVTTIQLQQTNRELLELMVKAIEARDPYTSGHSRRVADAATVIARGIGLNHTQVERVRIAALLHDIGKIDEVYAPILRKEGKLTPQEWEIMKTHPARGAELIATLSDLRDVVAPIRHHHEHWNGRGYPDGLAGDQIPLAARIITFADTLDALTTDRPYRRALGEEEVRAEFVKYCGTQFDPTVCGHVLAPATWSLLFPNSRRETPRPAIALVTKRAARAVAT